MHRYCNYHPHVRISSDCGLFDGVCGPCEAWMDEDRKQNDEPAVALVEPVEPVVVDENHIPF